MCTTVLSYLGTDKRYFGTAMKVILSVHIFPPSNDITLNNGHLQVWLSPNCNLNVFFWQPPEPLYFEEGQTRKSCLNLRADLAWLEDISQKALQIPRKTRTSILAHPTHLPSLQQERPSGYSQMLNSAFTQHCPLLSQYSSPASQVGSLYFMEEVKCLERYEMYMSVVFKQVQCS